MIYLITGVAGFIGSHLAEELICRNNKVIGVDNLFSGHMENLSAIKHNFRFINADATNYDEMAKLISNLKAKPDVYINMAAACLLYSLKYPIEGFNIEVKLCQTMCELARNKILNKIVQFSTSEVYGGNETGKKLDLNSTCFPKTTYAAGKLAADNLLKIYREKFGINGFLIRPFNNFGERQENAIIPVTIKKIIKNQNPIINGNGNQSRDFMYVKDTVKIVADILMNGDNSDVLLATGKKRKIKDIVKLVIQKMKYHNKIEYTPNRELDVDQLIGKQYKFNYTPFHVALNNTITWHMNNEYKNE